MTAWTHHDPAVRKLIQQAQADAWDEGHRFTGYEPERGENPYREETPMSQYANKTGAEIVHDYVLVRGDLSEQYARDQLAEVIDQRTARAEAAEAKIARVEALADEGGRSNRHANGYAYVRVIDLHAALADEGDTDE